MSVVSTGFTEVLMKEKLARLRSNAESIQTISLWIIHHNRSHGPAIVHIWLKEVMREKSSARLVNLIYLANDVIQNCRKKHPQFMKTFYTVLEDAFTHLGATPGKDLERAVEKTLKVWKDRLIYTEKELVVLRQAVAKKRKARAGSEDPPVPSENPFYVLDDKEATPQPEAEFDHEGVIKLCSDVLASLKSFEFPPSADAKTRTLISTFPETFASTALLSKVKNQKEALQLLHDVEAAQPVVDEYNERLAVEMKQRKGTQLLLTDFLESVKGSIDDVDRLLKYIKQEEDKLKDVQKDLKACVDNLPDEAEILEHTREPLPSAEELFGISPKK